MARVPRPCRVWQRGRANVKAMASSRLQASKACGTPFGDQCAR